MIKLKAWNARPLIDILSSRHWHFPVLRNSRAIAKFHNAEIDYFGHNAFIHELIRGSMNKKQDFIIIDRPAMTELFRFIEIRFEDRKCLQIWLLF